jgi:hypothetical protein
MEQQWPWSVPVRIEDVLDGGLERQLSADEATREHIAAFADLRTLRRLEADFVVTRRGRGLRVVGEVVATVGQACVITLDLVENEVVEAIDLVFEPPAAEAPEGVLPPDAAAARPEPLCNGSIDLGAIATEFLVLGIDPYPRKPGAVFAPPVVPATEDGPFAALARLKTKGIEPGR